MPKTPSTRNQVELEKPEKARAGVVIPSRTATMGRAIDTV